MNYPVNVQFLLPFIDDFGDLHYPYLCNHQARSVYYTNESDEFLFSKVKGKK